MYGVKKSTDNLAGLVGMRMRAAKEDGEKQIEEELGTRSGNLLEGVNSSTVSIRRLSVLWWYLRPLWLWPFMTRPAQARMMLGAWGWLWSHWFQILFQKNHQSRWRYDLPTQMWSLVTFSVTPAFSGFVNMVNVYSINPCSHIHSQVMLWLSIVTGGARKANNPACTQNLHFSSWDVGSHLRSIF